MTKGSIRKLVSAFNEKKLELDKRNADLHIARNIQQQFIPLSPLSINNYTISSFYRPSYFLSGDFFDYVLVGKDQVCIFVIDVIGHGIEASFTTLLIKSIFQKIIQTQNPLEPKNIISELNTKMCNEITLNKKGGYGFYGVLDTKNHTFRYCHCGIGVANHYRESNKKELNLYGGSGVGLFENTQYTEGVLSIKKNDVIIISTDGIEDIKDKSGCRIGRKWMDLLVTEYKKIRSEKTIINQIEDQIKRKTGHKNYFEDDIACICIEC